MQNVCKAIAFSAAHLFGSVCSAQVANPEYGVGDWWVFELHGSGDSRTQYKETVAFIYPNYLVVTTENGGKRRLSQHGNPLDANRAEIPLVTFPLEVGRKWSAKHDWKSGAYYGTNSMKYQVVAKEQVVVHWTTLTVSVK